MKKIIPFVGMGLGFSGLMGCGKARLASVEQGPLAVPTARVAANFSPVNRDLTMTQFLWRNAGTPAEQASRVTQVVNWSAQINTLADSHARLESTINAVSSAFTGRAFSPEDISQARTSLEEMRRQVQEKRNLITQEQQKPRPRTYMIRAWNNSILNLEQTEIPRAQALVDSHEAFLDREGLRGRLEQYQRLGQTRTELSNLETQSLDVLRQIASVTDAITNSVGKLKLSVDGNGQVGVKIEGADFGEGQILYSNENGKIQNVTYSSRGGIYEFDVLLGSMKIERTVTATGSLESQTETVWESREPVRLHYKLERTFYCALDHGTRLKGDFLVYRQRDGELLRRGMASMTNDKEDSGPEGAAAARLWGCQ